MVEPRIPAYLSKPDGESDFAGGERTFVIDVVGVEKPQTVKYAGKGVEVTFPT